MSAVADIIEEARDHYGRYYLAVNPNFKYVRYQQELIVPALEEIERGDNDRLMILIHPGASKSFLCTAGFMPWFIGRRPDRMGLVLSYGNKPARKFGTIIRDHFGSPVYQRIFPWSRLTAPKPSGLHFKTTRGGEVHASGWAGAVAGIRADLVIIDDPLKNYDEAVSEATMESRMMLMDTVVTDRLKPGGRIIICTNRWAPRDVVGRILEKERDRWKVITLPAEPAPEHPAFAYLERGTNYLWESYFGRDKYEDKKRDQWSWETTYQQAPEQAMPERFKAEWLTCYTGRVNPGRFHTWVLCDPALGQGRKNDRTCIIAVAGAANEKLLVVDAVLDRLDPDERTRALIKVAERWESDAILYEEVGMASDSFYLERDISRYGLQCPVIPVGRRGHRHMLSKETRIQQLIPVFKEGRILLPGRRYPDGVRPEFWYTQKDKQRIDVMNYFVNSEYLPWSGKNSIPHDEFLDCLSRILDEEFQMTYAEDDESPTAEEEGKRPDGEGQFEWARGGGGSGSWFSRF